MHQPLNPRGASVAIDANALNRDGCVHDALVDRLLTLRDQGAFRLIVPHGVREELLHPLTPPQVSKPGLASLYTLECDLTEPEQRQLHGIEAVLRGNAKAGKHEADARHLFEAGKYCSYFITHDVRVLHRSQGLDHLLPPSLTVVTLERFLEIFDEREAAALAARQRRPTP